MHDALPHVVAINIFDTVLLLLSSGVLLLQISGISERCGCTFALSSRKRLHFGWMVARITSGELVKVFVP